MRFSAPALSLGFLTLSVLTANLHAADSLAPGGNAARGKMLFQQMCALCHTTAPDGASGQGPNLAGVLSRRAASAADFGYTKALTESKLVWDHASLDHFLENPTAAVPGTNMVNAVPDDADRNDVIAYLATLAGSNAVAGSTRPSSAPKALPSPEEDDWRHDAPGVRRHITLASLPAPFASTSAGNGPKGISRPDDAKLSVLPGFTVKEFAANLSGPRIVRVAPNGDIFVAETRANRVRVLRAAEGAATPTLNQIFAEKLDRPFGIAFYPAGDNPQWIYIANNNSVVRFPYANGDVKAQGKPEVIVPHLSDTTGGHSTRDIAFSKDGQRLFISVGSGSNVADDISKKSPDEVKAWEAKHGRGAAWDSETNRAAVLVTDPEGREPLKIFATGIRNGVGIAVDPANGDLWTATNERDGLGDNLVPDYVTRVKEGGFYGWPWYYLGNHEEPRHAGERPDLAGVAIVPDVLLQAHSAALELAFYDATIGPAVFPKEYRGDIFVALHGSWNRHARTGYKVVRVLRKDGVPTGEYEDFLTGFVVNKDAVWGRPVGVAVAKDGALIVADDESNTLWRIAPETR